MKPVQQVLSLGIQIQLHVTYVLAAVGEEIDLLVGLHALGLKQLEQATFGLFIVGLNPGKAPSRELLFALLIPFKGQETLAGNHLELSLLVLPADIATVNPDRKRTIGRGKSVPASLAALDETELFVAQFLLQPLRYIRDVPANGERINELVDRQHVLQEFRRHPVAHERGPLGLQEQQLGQRVVRQQLGQWAGRFGFMRSAYKMAAAGTPPPELAKDGAERELVFTFAAPPRAAIRTSLF